MKFIFKNLGPINEAELELGDLTIIAGQNNTGKTYVAYTLYGFLLLWSRRPQLFSELEKLAKIVAEKGQVKLPLNQGEINEIRRKSAQEAAQNFSKERLAEVFSSPDKNFEDASIAVVIEDDFPTYMPSKTFESRTGYEFTRTYNSGELCLRISKTGRGTLPAVDLSVAFSHLFFSFLFPEFPEPFILTAERFGISLFYKELDFAKSRVVEVLQEIERDREGDSPFLLPLNKMVGQYARPIRDNIDYTRSIPDLQRRRSEIYDSKLFNNIREIMGGYYRSSGDDIRFKSKARKGGFDIPLHISSSSARGLSDLYFFLRHVAEKNQLLIIDEPESHLDTAKQIQFARLLAQAVDAGLKVLITTHSDYIVKEINNLLMLSQSFKDKPKVRKKLGYSERDFLKPDQVRAYVAEDNSLTRCTIEKYGINMPIFDTTIHDINKVSNELGFRLKHEGEK